MPNLWYILGCIFSSMYLYNLFNFLWNQYWLLINIWLECKMSLQACRKFKNNVKALWNNRVHGQIVNIQCKVVHAECQNIVALKCFQTINKTKVWLTFLLHPDLGMSSLEENFSFLGCDIFFGNIYLSRPVNWPIWPCPCWIFKNLEMMATNIDKLYITCHCVYPIIVL